MQILKALACTVHFYLHKIAATLHMKVFLLFYTHLNE